MTARPPGLTERLLALALPPGPIRDAVLGDLREEYGHVARSSGVWRARLWYTGQALVVGSHMLRRRVGRGEWMTQIAGEVRHAGRVLRRRWGSTALIVVTLALGIGGVTTVAAVMKGVVLSPLPYPADDEIILIQEARGSDRISVSYPNYLDWRARSRSFRELAAYRSTNLTLARADGALRLRAYHVDAELFDVLGVPALHGRIFSAEEDAPGGAAVAVLSHRLWLDAFGGRNDLASLTLNLDGETHQVVGVMPPDFDFRSAADLWLPLGRVVEGSELENRGARAGLYVVGRLAEDRTLASARAEMADISEELRRQYGDENRDVGAHLTPLREAVLGSADRTLLLVFTAATLLLLVACLNVASLLEVRSAERASEIAVRVAVGGSWFRIARQIVVESLVLSLGSGALGVGLAVVTVELVSRTGITGMPRMELVTVDLPVALGTMLLATVVGVGTALAPALALRSGHVRASLAARATDPLGPGRGAGRAGLVVAQVSLSVLLLVGAGLVARSLEQIFAEDLGFGTADVLTFRVEHSGYAGEEWPRLALDMVRRLEALPGVASAGVVEPLPLSGRDRSQRFWIEGRPFTGSADLERADYAPATRGYFGSLGIPLIAGRHFGSTDDGSPSVVLVSRSTAERFWPGEDALGKTVISGGPDSGNPPLAVVGIVGDVRHYGVRAPAPNQIYFHYPQLPLGGTVVLRAARGRVDELAPAIRRAVAEVDPSVPIFDLNTLDALFARSIRDERSVAWGLGFFGVVALLLTLFGVYAVVERATSRRMREMAIRAAFGAGRATLFRDVLRGAMSPVALGIAIGLAAALALSRIVESLLFGIVPSDPATYGLVALGVAAAALIASIGPSLRVMTTDPATALRDGG